MSLAEQLATQLGTAIEVRTGTPGGDTDGVYVPTPRARYVLRVRGDRFDVVRTDVQPRSGTRWIAVSADPFETAGADDDEAYVQITEAGPVVQLAASYGHDGELEALFPIAFCRAFLARSQRLLIERYLGAALCSFTDAADVDAAITTLELLAA